MGQGVYAWGDMGAMHSPRCAGPCSGSRPCRPRPPTTAPGDSAGVGGEDKKTTRDRDSEQPFQSPALKQITHLLRSRPRHLDLALRDLSPLGGRPAGPAPGVGLLLEDGCCGWSVIVALGSEVRGACACVCGLIRSKTREENAPLEMVTGQLGRSRPPFKISMASSTDSERTYAIEASPFSAPCAWGG